jgi:outer membrane protein TolC
LLSSWLASAASLGLLHAPAAAAAEVADHAAAHPLLTLDQALAEAESRNPDLRAARARLRQSEELGAKAWSGYLPGLTASAGYTRNAYGATFPAASSYVVRDLGTPQGAAFDPARPVGADNLPGAVTTEVAVPAGVKNIAIQKLDAWNAEVDFSQALIAPTTFMAIKSAYLAERSATLTTESSRREILYGVASAYISAASFAEVVDVQNELLGVRLLFERDAEARFSIGVVAKVALLRAQIDRARAEQDLVRARNAYESAKSSLAALLARPVDFEVAASPAEGEPPADAGIAASADGLALERRPDVAAARVNLDLAVSQRRGVKTQYLPNLALNANTSLSNVAGFTGHHDSWRIGVGLSWTLFDGGLREAQVREAAARVSEAEAARSASEERARDEVRRARLDLESARANRIKAVEQARLARENARLAFKSFQAGTATYIEVTDANSTLSTAERSAVTEDLNVRLARLSLAKALGDGPPP